MVTSVTSPHSSPDDAEQLSTTPAPMDHATLMDEMKNNDKLPIEERVRLARHNRELQLQRYTTWGSDDPHSIAGGTPSPRGVKLTFPEDVHLMDAAAKGSLADMEELLKRGVDPNKSNHEGLTALHQCCIDGHADMARLLLQHGASVNAVDRDGWTPLHAAATCGHLAIVRMLVDKGADLLAVNGDGDMPFDITEDEATLIFVEEAMTDKGITPDMVLEKRDELHNKVLSDVQDLIECCEPLDGPVNEDGATLLHVAVVNEFNDVVKLLLDHGASDTTEDAEGWRPIHAAAFWGNAGAIELLVKTRDTDLRAATDLGLEPLDMSEDITVRGKILELMNANERYSKKAEEDASRESRSGSHIESGDNVDSSDSPFLQLLSPDTEGDNNPSAEVEHRMESIFDDEGEGGRRSDDEGVDPVVLLPTLQRVESLGSRRNSVREAKKQAPMISQSHSKLESADSYDYSYDLMLTKKKTEIHKITARELTNSVIKEEEKNGVKEETQKVVYAKRENTVKENNQTESTADVNRNEFAVVHDGSDDDSSKGAVTTALRRDSSSSSSTSTYEENIFDAYDSAEVTAGPSQVQHRQGQAMHESSHQSDSEHEDQELHQLPLSRVNNNVPDNIYEESKQTLPSYENTGGSFSLGPPTPPATAPRTVFSDISYIQVDKHVDKRKTAPAYDNDDYAQVDKHAAKPKTVPAYDNDDYAQVDKHADIRKTMPANDNNKSKDILTEVSIREASRGRRETQYENDNVYENDLSEDDHVYESSTLPRGELEQVMIRPRPTSKSKPTPEITGTSKTSGTTNKQLKSIKEKSDRDSEANASLRASSSTAAANTDNEAAGEDIYTEIQLPGNHVPKRRTKKLEIPHDNNKSEATLVKPQRGSLQELKMKRLSLRQSLMLDINSGYEPLDASASTSRPTVRPYSSVDAMAASSNMYSNSNSSGDVNMAATAFKPPDSPTMIRHVFKQPVIVKERSIVTMKKRCSIM